MALLLFCLLLILHHSCHPPFSVREVSEIRVGFLSYWRRELHRNSFFSSSRWISRFIMVASDLIRSSPGPLPAPSTRRVTSSCIVTSTDYFNYAGRPIHLAGPSCLTTIQFTDHRGNFCWLDPQTHNVWRREVGVNGSLLYVCAFHRICRQSGTCPGTPDGVTPHIHGADGVPLHHLRQIRLEFSVRNYYALSREVPPLSQFLLVHAFYHNRIHGPSVATASFVSVPNWVVSSAKLGFPYTCEARRAGGDLSGIMQSPIRHPVALVEANSIFEAERFGSLDPLLKCNLPLDYASSHMLQPLVPTQPYVRRWGIPRKLKFLIISHLFSNLLLFQTGLLFLL